jgi:hypothetical protein
VDNTGDMNFDLEPGNVHMEMADDPNVRGQEDEEEEKKKLRLDR